MKYEFTGETKKYDGYTLHRIRRLSDGKIGGWIETENNLSQEGNCWVDDNAKVYGDAKVYGNASVYDFAIVCDDAKVYGDAYVYDWAEVCDCAEVYGDACINDSAKVYGKAKVYDKAMVYGNAEVFNDAWVYGDAAVCYYAQVYGKAKINAGDINYNVTTDIIDIDELTKVVHDFVSYINYSNKLEIRTEYSSIGEFFNEPISNDIKLDTLVICTVDTKFPLIKLTKVKKDDKLKYKFIVDINNEDGEEFSIKAFIESQKQLNKLIEQTSETLNLCEQLYKYADDLESCLCF